MGMKNKGGNSDKNYFDSLYNSYNNPNNNWNYNDSDITNNQNNNTNDNQFKYFNIPNTQNLETKSTSDNSLNIFGNAYFQNTNIDNINKNDIDNVPEIIEFPIDGDKIESIPEVIPELTAVNSEVSIPEIIDDIDINNSVDISNNKTNNTENKDELEIVGEIKFDNNVISDNNSVESNALNEEPDINEQFFNSWGNVGFNNNVSNTEVKPKIKSKNKFRKLMRDSSNNAFIQFIDVGKTYKSGETTITALHDVNFTINKGELVVILGSSGAGKSTALNALGGMDVVTSGKVIVDGKDIAKYSLEDLTDYRRKVIGFVFQFYNLVQNLTVKENVELATDICEDSIDAIEILEKVGLKERINNFPSQLSGGEQQRASIARAIAKKPKILLCDEPTGALDYKNGKQILKLLQDTCYDSGITEVIITHNGAIAPMADRVITFKSGTIVDIKENPNPVSVEDIEW